MRNYNKADTSEYDNVIAKNRRLTLIILRVKLHST